MISLLTPSRKRPVELRRMVESARATAANPPEIVVYCDSDDPQTAELCESELFVKFVQGPRILLGDTWNQCLPLVTGDILFQGNDKLLFLTAGWDRIVEEAFAEVPDRIAVMHGDDGGGLYRGGFGPQSFISRRWVDALGYFTAPFFSSDYCDLWLCDIADTLKRRKFLPFTIEHLHPMYKKAEVDQTMQDRLDNHQRDGVDELYELLLWKRERDVEKLRKLMFSEIDTMDWAPPRKRHIACPKCGSFSTVLVEQVNFCNKCAAQGWVPA